MFRLIKKFRRTKQTENFKSSRYASLRIIGKTLSRLFRRTIRVSCVDASSSKLFTVKMAFHILTQDM
ncbi:unnamed protein product [Rhizophagus irregularis]|nr:unnamed protein product [Rhizophagus irregularis]